MKQDCQNSDVCAAAGHNILIRAGTLLPLPYDISVYCTVAGPLRIVLNVSSYIRPR